MKIIINYDPYQINTKINIDDSDSNPMVNGFSPIKKYPLQVWLEPRLNWPGLAQKLVVLSRGRSVQLIFRGRTVDYNDLRLCLAGNVKGLELTHEILYEDSIPDEQTQIAAIIEELRRSIPQWRVTELTEKIKKILRMIGTPETPKMIHIDSEEKFQLNRDCFHINCTPVVINEDVFRSHSKEIEYLISTDFSRPYDSVFILIKEHNNTDFFSEQEKKNYVISTIDSVKYKEFTEKCLILHFSESGYDFRQLMSEFETIINETSEVVNYKINTISLANLHDTITSKDEIQLLQLDEWQKWINTCKLKLNDLRSIFD